MGGDTIRKAFQFTSMKNIDSKDFKAAWDEDSSTESSTNSCASGFSSDLLEDASSSGPSFELSGLLANLPRKRGLSMYYEGKSQSFASLGSVESLEDLAKKDNPQRKRLKYCSSYGGLDGHKSYRPKAAIQ